MPHPNTEIARRFRRKSTEAEDIVWDCVRNKQLGFKIYRQKPIEFIYNNVKRFFIADFYSREKNLIIEIDGPVHEKQKDYDELRDYLLSEMKYTILRFTNDEVMKDIDGVIEKIRTIRPHPLPPLRFEMRRGGGVTHRK